MRCPEHHCATYSEPEIEGVATSFRQEVRYGAAMVWKIVAFVTLAVVAVGSWVFIFIDRGGGVPADQASYSAVPASSPSASSATPSPSPSPTPTPTPVAASRITLPDGASVVIVGDSWAAGYAAQPTSEGFAPLTAEAMGWDLTNLGVGGTGYVSNGPDDEGNYAERIADRAVNRRVDLVILQGGLSDATTADVSGVTAGATKAIAAARTTWPSAQVVVLGPCPDLLPASTTLTSVDSQLAAVTSSQRLHYMSCLKDGWINSSNFDKVIDTNSQDHPSTDGHAYLATKVEAALREFIVTKS